MEKMSFKQKIVLVSFGLFLSLALLEIGLRIGGFVYLAFQEHENRFSLRQKGTYKILCLGESLTAMGGEYSYSRQLENILNQLNIGVKFTVVNQGIPGAKSEVIVSQLEYNLNKYKPDMVVTMMGENDAAVYEDISNLNSILSFKTLRAYKLINMLIRDFFNKTRGIILYKLRKDKVDTSNAMNDSERLNNFQVKEEILQKSLDANLKNDGIKAELGWLYWSKGEFDKAEEILKEIIALNPKNYGVFAELGRQYWSQGKYAKAEEIFKRAIEVNPINDKFYRGLAICYNEQGKKKSAEEYFGKAKRLRSKYYNLVTLHNYLKLKKIVIERGMKLVCVQPPMRSIDLLKQLLGSNKAVFFVDNEMVFENTILNGKYGDYFKDMCNVDSGHCTPKGYRLIAEQIANVILRECFSGLTK